MTYPDFDIIIQFDAPGVRYSHNGGKTWLHCANSWNSIDWIIRHIVNRFTVYHILNPSLKNSESLCGICASLGRVGIMRFDRFTEGKEAQTQCLYDSDGDPYYEDVYHWCRYRIDKCSNCGHEDSDYG